MRTEHYNNEIKARTSYKTKIRKNFARQKQIIDTYDHYLGTGRNQDKIDKYNVNYDLFNGRLDVELYDDPVCFNIGDEECTIDYQQVVHYPIISQVAQTMYGEIISRPFKPTVKQMGTSSQTLQKKKHNELLRRLAEKEIVAPIQQNVQQAFAPILAQLNVAVADPEQIKQLQQQIQAQIEATTPEEVLNFMENDYTTPTERAAQQLLDFLVIQEDIERKQQEGFKHAIISGEETYYIGDRHDEPIFQLCNPKHITYGGSRDEEWVQNMDWVKYEEWLSYEAVLERYGEHLSEKELKTLEGCGEPLGGVGQVISTKEPKEIKRWKFHELTTESELNKAYGDLNLKTKEGQYRYKQFYQNLLEKYGATHGSAYGNYGVRVAHFAWRDNRKMYIVKSIVDGQVHVHYEAEHYTKRPEDIDITTTYISQIWEGTKIGTESDVYINIRPTPNQYKSLSNPYGAELPYYGKAYNTHMGNSKNISVVDLGKPFQKEFDITMAQIKHDMATDFGKVFLYVMSLKPDNHTWQDHIDTMKNSKLLLINANKRGFTNIDHTMLKTVDLSRTNDIAAKIQMLEFFRNNVVQAMYFNRNRIGFASQYATNRNIQESQIASYNQTEGFFETHRLIVEKAVNAFMNRAKYVYKNKRVKNHFIFDDIARLDIETSTSFWYEETAITFSLSSEDIRRVEELRSNLLSFIQNGLSSEGVLGLVLADTPTDIIRIFRRESKRIEKERQEQLAQNQQMQQQQIQAEAQKEDAKMKADYAKEELKQKASLEKTKIGVQQMALANDIDGNKISDALQTAIANINYKREKDTQERIVKREEMALRYDN